MPRIRRAVIDTNVLVYDLVEDSMHHADASRLLDELDEWVIPVIVVHELVWVLRALNVPSWEALPLVRQYTSSAKAVVVGVELGDVVNALRSLASEKLTLSRYNDKVILSVAYRLKLSVASFDKRLRGQARRLGLQVLP